MARTLATLAACVLVLAGCNSADSGGSGAGTSADLTISVSEDGSEFQEFTLTCNSTGGSHPTPDAACDIVDQVGVEIFEPTPDDQACTMIFGGPQQASVTGTYDGSQINAQFSRSNGCEIARWDALGQDFFTIEAGA